MNKSKFQFFNISIVALVAMLVSCTSGEEAKEVGNEGANANIQSAQTPVSYNFASSLQDSTTGVALLPIAYVDMDSIYANYTFAVDANEKLMKKQEDARLKMNTKLQTFQNEYAEFERKLQNNAFLSRERAEKEQTRLLQKQQELQELEAQLTNEIVDENQKLVLQFNDSIDNFLKIYNADGRYHLILRNTAMDNVLFAAEQYNITKAVVDGRPQFHISIIVDVSPYCDCHAENDAPILPDIGMFASKDPLALDQACVDACLAASPMPGSHLHDRMHSHDFCDHHDHFRNSTPESEWRSCLEHAEKIGLGSREYELIK